MLAGGECDRIWGMDIERFGKSPSGRVIKVGQGEAAYSAFVPNALPPKIEFDMGLIQTLSNADRALGELSGLGRNIPNPQLLMGPFIRREAVLSSRIEGTRADLTDLYAYEAGHASPSLPPDVREVSNYVKALEYGLKRLETLPISLRFMRELHERLMEGVRGEYATPGSFRASQNWIGPPGCSLNQAAYVPPPVEQMHSSLAALEEYVHAKDDLPPLVRIALIHYQFEAIHPFLDGNGRIGRLLISLLLIHWGLLPLPLLYLSAYFEAHRREYYDLLMAIGERGAWHEWLMYFLRGVAEQAGDANARAKRLQDLQVDYRRRLMETRASTLPLKLMESLFEVPVITVPEAQRVLGVTYRAAKLNVEKLVKSGILRQADDNAYGKMFVCDDIVQATT